MKSTLKLMLAASAFVTVVAASSEFSLSQVSQGQGEPLLITHGVASGEISSTSAVIWARANRKAKMLVEVDADPTFSNPDEKTTVVSEKSDYAAKITLKKLTPDTLYYYRTSFSDRDAVSESQTGSFRTAPDDTTARSVQFVFAGDLGGQRYCRNTTTGYAIFAAMEALQPDFFVANGDLIYADGDCPAEGPDGPGGWENIPGDFPSIGDASVNWQNPEQVHDVYAKHWQYNLADPAYQSFRRNVPVYAQWDDHEVINDFGAPWLFWPANPYRPGFPNLVTMGKKALFDYNPLPGSGKASDRLYRSFNWGKHADLFLLDARSYRTENYLADTPENAKTLLGKKQLAWIKKELASSQATWKIISNDVPLSISTGGNAAVLGRDAWANGTAADFSAQTGFERELLDLLKFLDDENVKNFVFVTTDVHFTMNIAYQIDANGDGDLLTFHEFVTGPLNAVMGTPPTSVDPTLNPTILYSEGPLFNFGFVQVHEMADGKAHLLADVRDVAGVQRPGSVVDLTPQ